MSLLGWLSQGARKPRGRSSSLPDSSGFSRMDATRPLRTGVAVSHEGAAGRATPAAGAGAGGRRSERLDQRERLYSVVRESMVRSGVLSSGYKFKVLSLDARGSQFLVMMDLARELAREPTRLTEVEGLIAQVAKQRFGIVVTAVYWRLNEQVVVNASSARVATAAAQAASPGAASANTRDAAVVAAPAPALPPGVATAGSSAASAATPHAEAAPSTVAPARPGGGYEPLQADEIAAFKDALAGAVGAARAQTAARLEAKAGAQLREARDAKIKADAQLREARDAKIKADAPRKLLGWPRRAAPLTGFEDTEAFAPSSLPPDPSRPQTLSETQYGDLH
ncbi:MAG: hypothetical protein KA795_07120 [Burkholderiaceae bacterium]|nr:hypothetical protein [Burkholderiaceae bacterium]